MTAAKLAAQPQAATTGAAGSQLIVLLCSVVGETPSGGDYLALELARHWPSDQPRPIVLTSVEGKRQIDELGIGGFTVELLDPGGGAARSRMTAWSLRSLKTPRAARRLVNKTINLGLKPLVFSTSPFPPDVAAGLAARLAGARWIQSWQLVMPPPWTVTSRGHRLRSGLSYLSQQVCVLMARRWCHTIVVPIELMAAEAARRGFSAQQIHVAPLAADPDQVAGASATGPVESFDAIFVGRFHAQKGLDDLLAVWKLVEQRSPRARLAVVGDGEGSEAARFKAGLDEFDPKTVRRLGILMGPRKYALMGQAKVFLLPSHLEARPHVVIEAMACGLPVVGYDLPWSREAFGDAVLRVPVGDVHAFADAVLSLLTDGDKRNLYRERGKRLAASLDWQTIARNFYEEVTA